MRRPPLKVRQILTWADEFHEVSGRWPRRDDGRINGSLGETWNAMEQALRKGHRTLPGKSSLAQLLQKHRGARNKSRLPHLTVKQILQWADHHHALSGSWPHTDSGKVLAGPGESWTGIDQALRRGKRGLRTSCLAGLLTRHRHLRKANHLPPLTIRLILRWAINYHRRSGSWPQRSSGAIPEAPGETWARVNWALAQGDRGFRPGGSLAQLLAKHGKCRNRKGLPPLRIKKVVAWADQHRARTGRWPTYLSGVIPGSAGETWNGIHSALVRGYRGLPGGSSLFQILKKHRHVPAHR